MSNKRIRRVRIKGTNDDGWVENTGGVMTLDEDGECYLGEAFYMHAMMLEIEYEEDCGVLQPNWHDDGCCNGACPFASTTDPVAGCVSHHHLDYVYCRKHKTPIAWALHICPSYVTSLDGIDR